MTVELCLKIKLRQMTKRRAQILQLMAKQRHQKITACLMRTLKQQILTRRLIKHQKKLKKMI